LTVTEIDAYGFAYCMDLEDIYIPPTVTTIGFSAFMGCSNLRNTNLLKVEEIDDCAYSFCENLDTVVLPDTLEYVGESAFMFAAPQIYVAQSEEETQSWGNWLGSYGGNIATDINYSHDSVVIRVERDSNNTPYGYSIVNCGKIGAGNAYNDPTADLQLDILSIPTLDGTLPLVGIESAAFSYCTLHSLTVGANSTHAINVKTMAFGGSACNIGTVEFGDNVTFLMGEDPAANIFSNSKVEKVYLPNTLTEIPSGMFSGCTYLTAVRYAGSTQDNVLPSTVTSIGRQAFSSCGLQYLFIPASVTNIERDIFVNWQASKTVAIDLPESQVVARIASGSWASNWKGGNPTVLYRPSEVSFEASQYGSNWYSPISVPSGYSLSDALEEFAITIAEPTSDSHTFTGWYANSSCTTPFDFDDLITDHTTIYAGWSFKQVTITMSACDFANFYLVNSVTGNMVNGEGSQFSVNYGSTLYFKVTGMAACYNQSTPIIETSPTGMSILPDQDGLYTVSNITENLTLFVGPPTLNEYSVSLTENDYLTFTPVTYGDVTHGNSFSFTVSVNAAYDQSVPQFKFNGYTYGYGGTLGYSGGVYTISSITNDITVTVSQMPVNQYEVEFNGGGYLYSSLSTTYVYYGGNVSFTVSPNAKYTQAFAAAGSWGLFSVSDGQLSLSNGVYTISDVQSDVTVTAQALNPNVYTVTLNGGIYGTMQPSASFSNPITVLWGEDFSFSFAPNAGYSQAPLSNSNISISGTYSYYGSSSNTVYGITSDITITITSLSLNVYMITLYVENDDPNNFSVNVSGLTPVAYVQHGTSHFNVNVTATGNATAYTLTVYFDGIEQSNSGSTYYSFTATGNMVIRVVLTN
jgi:hypothetical protein